MHHKLYFMDINTLVFTIFLYYSYNESIIFIIVIL